MLQWGHGAEAVETPSTAQPIPMVSTLQWGHGAEAVETYGSPFESYITNSLQWGHGAEAVETYGGFGIRRLGERASMGPRRGGRGNGGAVLPAEDVLDASMGPRRGGRGDAKIPPALMRVGRLLQWGHGSEAVEIIKSRHELPVHVVASMGPRL